MSSAITSRVRILAAALLFSTGGAAVKATTFSAWQVAGLRSGIAALVVFLLQPPRRHQWTWRALLVGAIYGSMLILFVQGNKLTTAANTVFSQGTAPLYVLLLSPWLLGERLRRRDFLFVLAFGLGLGLLVAGRPAPSATAPHPLEGNVIAAACGLFWGFTLMALRWSARSEKQEGVANTAPVVAGNLFACLACLPFALPLTASTPANWLVVAFLGVFQVGVAYVLLTGAMQQVPAFEASLLLLLEPVLNPVWAWLVHGEVPAAIALCGGAVILVATTVKTWFDTVPSAS